MSTLRDDQQLVKIVPLDRNNYTNWRWRMSLLLRKLEVWEVIENDFQVTGDDAAREAQQKAWKKKDDTAYLYNRPVGG
jgi:Domain of unknown function (DUF4219)